MILQYVANANLHVAITLLVVLVQEQHMMRLQEHNMMVQLEHSMMEQLVHSMIPVLARSMDPGSRPSYVATFSTDDRKTDGSDACRRGHSKALVRSRQVRGHSRLEQQVHNRMELHRSLQEHMSRNWIV